MTSHALKDSTQRDGDEPINEVQKSWLRSLLAVLGYLATDRSDLQYPVKKLMREVTHATCGTESEHDVLCGTSCAHRVLHGRSQLSFNCSTLTHSLMAIGQKRDETQEQLVCRDQTGKVCAETSSTQQGVISLSSGKAELCAAIRAAACGIQLQQIIAEIGCHHPLRIHSDSAAARGMVTRRGPSQVKHLDIEGLWCQEAIEQGRCRLRKVDSENNHADIGTKAPCADRFVHLLRLLGMDAE